MNILNYIFKIVLLQIIVIFFFSTLSAKNVDKFTKGNYISDYFSGIILLNNNQYEQSYSFLKQLNGLESSHLNYSGRYLFSLVNSGKFNEAFNFSKKLEKKKLSNFESELIMGVYYLKNNNLELAKKYFAKIKNRNSKFLLNNFISNSLYNWLSFSEEDFNTARKKLNQMDNRFVNLKKIQNIFLHCFYKSPATDSTFDKLVSNDKTDFSRYYYFYGVYLVKNKNQNKASKVLDYALNDHPRNLLLNQLKQDLEEDKLKLKFNCENKSDVIAEILYVTANALSSQNFYNFSNFYINVSKYLNKDFYSYDNLLAENLYEIENYKRAKKVYRDMGKNSEIYNWHATKQISKILIKENKEKEALKLTTKSYDKLTKKTIYEKFDFARFLKNNKKFEHSVKIYSEVLDNISQDHPLFPRATDGRGVSYERLWEWKKAEKDLLSSLKAKPDQAYVINYLAYSWIEQGVKIEKSLKMLEKANRLKPNDPYIIDSLGWALFKLKRYNDAKKYLKQAVQLMPADPVVNDHYGDVLWKTGKQIQARYYWNYVLKLDDTEDDLKKTIKNKIISGL